MSVPRSRASPASSPLQSLDTLLSQAVLPYQESLKPTIRSHLSSLLREFPSLQVKIEAFTHSDGSPPSLLLQVGGTIPILFLQVLYNIPVVMWLSKEYPSSPPLIFVTPSPFMIIKTAHPLVNPSGLVSSPFLHSWVFPASTLVDLARSLCAAFGQDPPLYSVMLPPQAHGVKFSVASPLPASTSAMLTSTSLLGPGVPLQQYPLHANGIRVSMSHSLSPATSPASTSASLLGPGSLSQRWPSHGHITGLQMASTSQPSSSRALSSSQRYSSHPHGSGVYHLPAASSSSTSAGSLGPLSTAQQHPANVHSGVVSMAPSSSSLSTSVSLLGPGKVSHLHSSDGAGRHKVLPNPGPQLLAGLSNRPSLSQGYSPVVCDVRMTTAANHPPPPSLVTSSTSHGASLLGPGKVSQLQPLHDARNSSAHLSMPATSASLIGPCPMGQSHPPHTQGVGISMGQTPRALTIATSASLLGARSLSQRHTPHVQVGVSTAHPPQLSTSASTSISSFVSDIRLQQHPGVNHANGTGSNPPSSTMSCNPTLLIPMSQYAGPPFASQNHFYPSNLHPPFLNPLSGTTDLSPETRQNIMDTLIGRLESDIGEFRKTKEMDMLRLMDIEGLLKKRRGFCDKGIEELQQQKENLEVQLQTFLINTEFLETWLEANNKSKMEIDINEVFEICDGLSNQLLECMALDLAIEDALYCLEKATQEGILPVDSYLRHVRTLSREQFFHRAIALKVSAAQAQCENW